MELVALEALPRGAEYPLGPAPLTLGRAPSCGVVIEAEGVSGEHCRIRPSENGYLIEDLDSRNGTIVNGQLLATPVVLRPGDLIVIGPALLEVRGAASAGSGDRPKPSGQDDGEQDPWEPGLPPIPAGTPASVAAAARAAELAGRTLQQRLNLVLGHLADVEAAARVPDVERARAGPAVDAGEARRVLAACRRAAAVESAERRVQLLRSEVAVIERVLGSAWELLERAKPRRGQR